jgi:crotonobetainyl-CoA:carnitine CoA-transferase CaiB-like acyl-CoA transferase
MTDRTRAALHGLKVLEIGHLLAGPLAGTLMADLGADVIHVEDPEHGDPIRRIGPAKDGRYIWWKVTLRNKRSATFDLRDADGQEGVRRLAGWADVVITNFRPATLEGWGLDFESLKRDNPKLVMLQVSGYGLASSKRDAPGYGKVGEARSGVVHLTGFPDGPPVHAGFSHADTITGLMGAFAIQAAMYRRLTDPDFEGELIDLAVDETLFRLIEWQVPLYDQLGDVPERIGNGIPGAPSSVVNAFKTADGRWMTITSGTVRSIQNIAALVGEPVDQYESFELIARHRPKLESRLEEWMAAHTTDECQTEMDRSGVVAAPIFDVADILDDPTFAERGNVATVPDRDFGQIRMPGVIPRLTNHPGDIWQQAPTLGADDGDVAKEAPGLTH